MKQFRRAYIFSAMVLCSIVVLSILSSLASGQFLIWHSIISFLIGLIVLLPILRNGGVTAYPRLSISISAVLTIGFAVLLGFVFSESMKTKGLEGPNGEGAPGAAIFAMIFFAAAFFCPWLLTTIRGIPLWNCPNPVAKIAHSEDS